MKMTFRLAFAFALSTAIIFVACKKEADNTQPSTEISAEVKDHSDDQSRVSGDMDDVANDADAALEGSPSFTGRYQNTTDITSVCGATAVADTSGNNKTITVTYNGNNCQNTTFRTGSVVISMPRDMKWKNAGAYITVAFQNLKIKRLSDNKSITINGTQTITNVNGGLLLQLSAAQSIVHTITSSNMSITFDDGSQRTWQMARKRTFTSSNGMAVLTITGIGASGNLTNVAEWGTNRYGHAFTTSITGSLVFRQDCSGRLTSGEIKHEGFATATVKFGLNEAGQATTCPGTGKYYYRLTWTGPGGNSISTILPY